jgi:hypothetical protein
VSIGANKYLINVYKNSNLQQLVSEFLSKEKLSKNYEQAILTMIEKKLNENKMCENTVLNDLKKVKEDYDRKKN